MASERRDYFHNALRSFEVGEWSPNIPEDLGRHMRGIPTAEDLTAVPDSTVFPIEDIEKAEELSEEELRRLFAQVQIQTIVSDPSSSGDNNEDDNFVGPIIEIPTVFSSVEKFINFKRELQTVYNKKSEDMGWTEPVHVCADPLCINSTPPTFQYCLYHLPLDPNFPKQKLIGQCTAKVDDHQCTIPCGAGQTRCAFHRSSPKD